MNRLADQVREGRGGHPERIFAAPSFDWHIVAARQYLRRLARTEPILDGRAHAWTPPKPIRAHLWEPIDKVGMRLERAR